MTSPISFPLDAQVLHVNDATVPFVTFIENGMTYIGFDTSACLPPEPMINAMLALELLQDSDTKVVMINHRSPLGLLAKVESFYDIDVTELGNGKLQLLFSYREGRSEHVDLSQKHCAG